MSCSKVYKEHRAMLFAAVNSLVQSLGSTLFGIFAILMHACIITPTPPPSSPPFLASYSAFSSNFYLEYFHSKQNCLNRSNEWGKNENFTLGVVTSSDHVQIMFVVYLVDNAIWLLTTILFLIGISKQSRWIHITYATSQFTVMLYDVILCIIFGLDIHPYMKYMTNYLSVTKSDMLVNIIIMMLISTRFLIFFIVNIVFFVYVVRAIKLLKRGSKSHPPTPQSPQNPQVLKNPLQQQRQSATVDYPDVIRYQPADQVEVDPLRKSGHHIEVDPFNETEHRREVGSFDERARRTATGSTKEIEHHRDAEPFDNRRYGREVDPFDESGYHRESAHADGRRHRREVELFDERGHRREVESFDGRGLRSGQNPSKSPEVLAKRRYSPPTDYDSNCDGTDNDQPEYHYKSENKKEGRPRYRPPQPKLNANSDDENSHMPAIVSSLRRSSSNSELLKNQRPWSYVRPEDLPSSPNKLNKFINKRNMGSTLEPVQQEVDENEQATTSPPEDQPIRPVQKKKREITTGSGRDSVVHIYENLDHSKKSKKNVRFNQVSASLEYLETSFPLNDEVVDVSVSKNRRYPVSRNSSIRKAFLNPINRLMGSSPPSGQEICTDEFVFKSPLIKADDSVVASSPDLLFDSVSNSVQMIYSDRPVHKKTTPMLCRRQGKIWTHVPPCNGVTCRHGLPIETSI